MKPKIYQCSLQMKIGERLDAIKETLMTCEFLIGIAHLPKFRNTGQQIYEIIHHAFWKIMSVLDQNLCKLTTQVRPFEDGRPIKRKKPLIIPPLINVLSTEELTYVVSCLYQALTENNGVISSNNFIENINAVLLNETITFNINMPQRRAINKIEETGCFLSNALAFIQKYHKSDKKVSEILVRSAVNYFCSIVFEQIIPDIESGDNNRIANSVKLIQSINSPAFCEDYDTFHKDMHVHLIRENLMTRKKQTKTSETRNPVYDQSSQQQVLMSNFNPLQPINQPVQSFQPNPINQDLTNRTTIGKFHLIPDISPYRDSEDSAEDRNVKSPNNSQIMFLNRDFQQDGTDYNYQFTTDVQSFSPIEPPLTSDLIDQNTQNDPSHEVFSENWNFIDHVPFEFSF